MHKHYWRGIPSNPDQLWPPVNISVCLLSVCQQDKRTVAGQQKDSSDVFVSYGFFDLLTSPVCYRGRGKWIPVWSTFYMNLLLLYCASEHTTHPGIRVKIPVYVLNSLICPSNWTSWIVFHCIIKGTWNKNTLTSVKDEGDSERGQRRIDGSISGGIER